MADVGALLFVGAVFAALMGAVLYMSYRCPSDPERRKGPDTKGWF